MTCRRGTLPAAVHRVATGLLPALLVLGLVAQDDDLWRHAMEIAVTLVFAYCVWRWGVGPRRGLMLMAVPAAWIAWLGMSGAWGTPAVRADWDAQSMGALLTAMFFAVCVTFLRVAPPAAMIRVAVALVAASAVPIVMGLVLHVAQFGLTPVPRISGAGFYENPNRAAAMIALTVLLALFAASRVTGRGLRLALAGYVGLALVYLLLTGSRGGLITLVLTIGAYEITREGRGFAFRVGLVGAALLVVLVTLALLLPGVQMAALENLTRSSFRLDIWQETLRLAGERPVLGYGLKYEQPILDTFAHPHNLHLSNLLYGGVPALVLGLATFAVAADLAWSIPDRGFRALAMGGLVLAFSWTFPNGSVPISKPDDDWYHFWIAIAPAWGFALRSPGTDQNGQASASRS
jgi:O-antigen ligase